MSGKVRTAKGWMIWTPDCGFLYEPNVYQTRKSAEEARGSIFEQVSMSRSWNDLKIVRVEIREVKPRKRKP